MGRTTASRGDARSSLDRKDARAKHAKNIIHRVIPALLQSDARARKGVDSAALIVDGAENAKAARNDESVKGKRGGGRKERKARGEKERRRDEDDSEDEEGAPPVQHAGKASSTVEVTESLASTTSSSYSSFNVRLLQCDSLTAARTLRESTTTRAKGKSRNIAVHNMASPLRPGGGVLNGAMGQEEVLCIRTTLYPSLKEEWYRLPELGVIWTPDVCVFRDEEAKELSKADRWYIDVISAAALRFPDVTEDDSVIAEAGRAHDEVDDAVEDGAETTDSNEESEDEDSKPPGPTLPRQRTKYTLTKDHELMVAKMTAVLRALSAQGTREMVLGAWGCGAYGNPVSEIARAWKEALFPKGRSWTGFEEIVFAIPERRLAEDFAREFGQDLSVESVEQRSVKKTRILEAEDLKLKEKKELQERVEQLEEQIEQSRFPDLRERLAAVLESLKMQLSDMQQDNQSE